MDRAEVCDRFLDQLQYDPYPFQEEALLSWFEGSAGVLVAAPTGMGKTLIAEAAIFEALLTGRRLYYTTPLIALTDQKFREFQDLAESWGYPREAIGLVTGNRKVNPDALVRVVVAEILLNHLLAGDAAIANTAAVVMDEFHYFNDRDRGIVWELSLVLLPAHAQLLLLSATVGNAGEFVRWLDEAHGRSVQLVTTDERRVPLEFVWVEDKLTTELLPNMVSADDEANRTPVLVFCFNRDACWEAAERLKGLKLIGPEIRSAIEQRLEPEMFKDGIGPKLRQMLIRGVGVHHAGVLPKYKEVIENLFLKKLVPFVVCTETLAAGINLPARAVVIRSLVKGPRGQEKLIPPSAAHQMFGRAGRPQFDSRGYVYALAHEDDVRIAKWKKKYEALDPTSKDPGIMRARKDLERKKPSRRRTAQYWTAGQFNTLIEAGPGKLASRTMVPYHVLLYLLHRLPALADLRDFLRKRFNTAEYLEKFQTQLDGMLSNLEAFGFLQRTGEDDVVLDPSATKLLTFRSVDPLYGSFLARRLSYGSFSEKLQVLESILPIAPGLRRKVALPEELEPGPLQTSALEPELISKGILLAGEDGRCVLPWSEDQQDYYDEDREPQVPAVADMLKLLFESELALPEIVHVQPQWIAGGILDGGGEFFKFAQARELVKHEGILLRHLLRLVILSGEFLDYSGDDPDYDSIAQQITAVCSTVDPRYTDHFLADQQTIKETAL
jgi:superfamily II DNA/RNA helicase